MARDYTKYDKDTDYQALINAAVAAGDYKGAWENEQYRNAKIAGEGLGYEQTHNFGSVYDFNNLSNEQLGQAYNSRMSVKNGGTDEASSHEFVEGMRSGYGYSGGRYGNEYIPINSSSPSGSNAGSSLVNSGLSLMRSTTNKPFTYENAGQWADKYTPQIDALTQQILGRAAFEYDPEKDPNFLQYRDQYTRNGKLAMEDTLGQVSARTGGLASSFAGTAAQQTYDSYMQALNDKVPELRQIAYSMYKDEGNEMRSNLEMLQALQNGDFNRYAMLRQLANSDRDFAYGVYNDSANRNMTLGQTLINQGNNDRTYDQNERFQQQNMDYKYASLAQDDRFHQDTMDYNYANLDFDKQQWQDKRNDAEWEKQQNIALTLAAAGSYEALSKLWELKPEQAEALVNQYAEEKRKSEDEAARDLADWYAQYGSFDRLKDMGINTAGLQKMWGAKVTDATTPKATGGSGGSNSSKMNEFGVDTSDSLYKDVLAHCKQLKTADEVADYLGAMEDLGLDPNWSDYIFSVALGYSDSDLTDFYSQSVPTSDSEFVSVTGDSTIMTESEFYRHKGAQSNYLGFNTYKDYLAKKYEKYKK